MISVSKLIIYPIKSCAGIEVEEANLTKDGLELDRIYAIIDKDNKIITARTHPQLVNIHPKIIEVDGKTEFKISIKDKQESVLLDPNTKDLGEEVLLDLWESKDIQGFKLNKETCDFFSNFLNESVSIVRKGSKPRQVIDFYLNKEGIENVNSETGFADGFPLLLLSEESVAYLQTQLPDNTPKVSYRNFRPNILVSGVEEAHKEDEFNLIKIDGIKLHCDIPCTRCSLPNVNPDDGIKDNLEPSKTLAKYRRAFKDISKYKAFFGINVIPLEFGALKVGQQVSVESWSKK